MLEYVLIYFLERTKKLLIRRLSWGYELSWSELRKERLAFYVIPFWNG